MKTLLTLLMLFTASISSASTLFFEDFESGLGQWDDTYHGVNAQTVVDPLNVSNKVLNFTGLNAGGDLFSTNGFTSIGNSFILSFDYLGTCNTSNCGGFIGISDDTSANSHSWLGGTDNRYPDLLPDTGSWEHVIIAFSSPLSAIHLMLEDFSGSGGVAGDAYFDNILLTDKNGPSLNSVPVPSALILLAPVLIAFVGLRRKFKMTIA